MDTWTHNGKAKSACAVNRRERQLARYHDNPAPLNYARTRRALHTRIARKRAQVEELETQLHEEENEG